MHRGDQSEGAVARRTCRDGVPDAMTVLGPPMPTHT